MLYDNGILMTNGFSIASAKPADTKFIADTLDDRNSYIINNLAYEGMLVYVKETKKTYQYNSIGEWEEFGFNLEEFESQVIDNLISESSTMALSAKQGKVLNDKINTHTNDNIKHITSVERTAWNAKASTAIATTTSNGLMSKTDKSKLDGIAINANNYVHPDSHDASMIDEDSTHRFVSDTEKSTWNAKASTAIVTQTTNGLMIAADKKKLDGIEESANNYTHPSTHAATMITTDTTHRFVTDAEKTTWNSKASTSVVTVTANGLMIAADKKKLDGIEEGANKYVHPTTHAASIITQDATHRFVSDAQITAWNNIADTIDIVSTTTNGLMIAEDKVKLNGIENFANRYTHPTTHAATIITQDATHRFVTDAQIANWNGKPSTAIVTQTTNGLMIAEDKVKLDGIATNANNYVHPSTHAATIITQDATHRFVSDTEKSTWNGKASTSVATQTLNGLMSKADKTKLDGIATNANNYVHPSTHAATIITQDATHRFVTDAEKSTWNSKASTAIATASTDGLMSKTDKSNLDKLLTRMQNMEDQQASMLAKLKTAVFIE